MMGPEPLIKYNPQRYGHLIESSKKKDDHAVLTTAGYIVKNNKNGSITQTDKDEFAKILNAYKKRVANDVGDVTLTEEEQENINMPIRMPNMNEMDIQGFR